MRLAAPPVLSSLRPTQPNIRGMELLVRNNRTTITALTVVAIYVFIAATTRVVMLGIFPVLLSVRAFRRREKLAPLALAAAILAVLIAVSASRTADRPGLSGFPRSALALDALTLSHSPSPRSSAHGVDKLLGGFRTTRVPREVVTVQVAELHEMNRLLQEMLSTAREPQKPDQSAGAHGRSPHRRHVTLSLVFHAHGAA